MKVPFTQEKTFFQDEMAAEADRHVHLKHIDFVFPSYVGKTFRYSELESKRVIWLETCSWLLSTNNSKSYPVNI